MWPWAEEKLRRLTVERAALQSDVVGHQ